MDCSADEGGMKRTTEEITRFPSPRSTKNLQQQQPLHPPPLIQETLQSEDQNLLCEEQLFLTGHNTQQTLIMSNIT